MKDYIEVVLMGLYVLALGWLAIIVATIFMLVLPVILLCPDKVQERYFKFFTKLQAKYNEFFS